MVRLIERACGLVGMLLCGLFCIFGGTEEQLDRLLDTPMPWDVEDD